MRGEAPDPNRADGSAPGSSRPGPGSASAAFGSEAGLKPMTDETRRMPPFGSPKGEGRHDQASRRRTGGVASSQVDPPQGGTGAHAQRHGRWRDRSPLRLPECLDGPAPLAFVPPPDAPREVRLNGFPGALAEVPCHRFGGGGRRVPGAVPTGVFGASRVGQARVGQASLPIVIQWGWRGVASAPPSIPPLFALPWRSRTGPPPPSPVPVRRDA